MEKRYRLDIDVLKGVAIIAVIFYHSGLLKSGYLGVDAFFVINGFFIVPSVASSFSNGSFSYVAFLKKRFLRLFPLISLATLVAMVIGYFVMLPDDYENLAQSSIASNFMSENILSAITTRSYWDVSNDVKPLMHLWYVGILFEFYIVLPFLFYFSKWLTGRNSLEKTSIIVLSVLSFISLIIYILPIGSVAARFYYLPFRFFELGLGGIVGLSNNRQDGPKKSNIIGNVSFGALVILFSCALYYWIKGAHFYTGGVIGLSTSSETGLPIPAKIALLMTVTFTSLFVGHGSSFAERKFSLFAFLGKMSFSLFVTHQIIIAFYRYCISNVISAKSLLLILASITICSILCFYFVERQKSQTIFNRLFNCLVPVCVLAFSGSVYIHSGVVRDVPELDVYKADAHRGMFSEYCDRVYQYKEFDKESKKKNVLVVGVSFGRDFANVLLESNYTDSISLVYGWKWSDNNLESIIKDCDCIFSFSSKEDVPQYVWDMKKESCMVWGISTKNFGYSNGIVYKNRHRSDYYEQSVEILPGYMELNELWKEQWGDYYIDMLSIPLVDDKRVRVFTDDKKFISQDCSHLTPAGARWYAQNIDWPKIFNI